MEAITQLRAILPDDPRLCQVDTKLTSQNRGLYSHHILRVTLVPPSWNPEGQAVLVRHLLQLFLAKSKAMAEVFTITRLCSL